MSLENVNPGNPPEDSSIDGMSPAERELRDALEARKHNATDADKAIAADIVNTTRPSRQVSVTAGAAAIVVLDHNDINRHVSIPKVRGYASDMTAGDWQVNHHGIAITPAGRLGDGQHRLMACAVSGVTIPLMVTPNIPLDAIHSTIDLSTRRTPGSALDMQGVADGSAMATVYPSVARYMAKARGEAAPYLSNIAIQRGVRTNEEKLRAGIAIAIETARGTDAAMKQSDARLFAVVALMLGWPADKVRGFLSNVQRGESDYTDAPTLALARLMMKANRPRNDEEKLPALGRCAISLRGLDLWHKRRSVSRLTWRANREGYPQPRPEEDVPLAAE